MARAQTTRRTPATAIVPTGGGKLPVTVLRHMDLRAAREAAEASSDAHIDAADAEVVTYVQSRRAKLAASGAAFREAVQA